MLNLFQPKEIKAIVRELDRLERESGLAAFGVARRHAEEEIKKHRSAFIEAVAKSRTPPAQIAAATIANCSGDLLEGGTLCLHRGILNPLGDQMMIVFERALRSLISMGAATETQVADQLSSVRASIRSVG